MRRERQFNPTGHLLLGMFIASIGVLFTLENLDILHARQIFRYWPVLLIVFGLLKMGQAAERAGRIGGALMAFAGTILLGNRLGYLHFNIWSLWPLVLVYIGLRMMTEAGGVRVTAQTFPDGSPQPNAGAPSVDAAPSISALAILGHVDRKITSQVFQHAEVTAFMGGAKLDLREASLARGGAVINVMVMMGGVEIMVPQNWHVTTDVTPILSGVEDQRRPVPAGTDIPNLIVRGSIIMGGIELTD